VGIFLLAAGVAVVKYVEVGADAVGRARARLFREVILTAEVS
jgi:hypothetical protein